jgi:hypothetical protein
VVVGFRADYNVVEALAGKLVHVTHEADRTVTTMELLAGAVAVLKASRAE